MLFNIYKKELRDAFRDRRTLLLTVFLPIIMMTGLTLFYESLVSDGEEDTFKLAVSETIPTEIAETLSTFDNIKLVKTANPEESFKNGDVQASLIVPAGFMKNIEAGKQVSMTMVGDSFSEKSTNLMNLVSNGLSSFEESVITKRLEAEGTNPDIIRPFTIETKELSDEDPNINLLTMLIPLILSLSIGVGSGPAAADLFSGEKERKTMEALLMTPVNRATMLFAKWLTISTIGTIIGFITLLVVVLEITFLTEHLKSAVSLGDNTSIIVVIALLTAIIYAMFTASILMLTSIIGKSIKEAQSYSSPIMMLIVFPGMILAGISVNELSLVHFMIPIMNLFSLIKELLFGIVNYEHILITTAMNLLCMLVIFTIGRIMFMKDKWVIN